MLGFAQLEEVWSEPKKKKLMNPMNKREIIKTLPPPISIVEPTKPHIESVEVTPLVNSNIEAMTVPVDTSDKSITVRITNPIVLNALKKYTEAYKQELIISILENAFSQQVETFIPESEYDYQLLYMLVIGMLILVSADYLRTKYFSKRG